MSKIPQEAIEAITWLDLDTAPKDGTIVKLKVLPGSGDDDACTSFEDSNDPYITIGFNQFCDTTVDEWDFAGWDWCHDCFTKGCGQVLAWAPFNSAADVARAQGAEVVPVAWQRQRSNGEWSNIEKGAVDYFRDRGHSVRPIYTTPPAPKSTDREKVLEEIAAERARQITDEGWTSEHDDQHDTGQMAEAAAGYALKSTGTYGNPKYPPNEWPWDIGWWKPTTPRRDLVKAAALLVAEIERLDRAALAGEAPSQTDRAEESE